MVKTRESSHARINKNKLADAISIFGKTLTHRVTTDTVDSFGQLSASTTTDTEFIGDLQFGLDLDQKYVKTGIVEVGDAILYIHPDALSTLPVPDDIIVDGDSKWEILQQIESPELGGTVCHYSYRCKRLINASDV